MVKFKSLKWQLSVSAKKCVMLQLGHSNKHFKGTLRRRLTYIFYRSVKSVIYHIFTYKVWTVNFYRKGPVKKCIKPTPQHRTTVNITNNKIDDDDDDDDDDDPWHLLQVTPPTSWLPQF